LASAIPVTDHGIERDADIAMDEHLETAFVGLYHGFDTEL
jgi:hypothetical protein